LSDDKPEPPAEPAPAEPTEPKPTPADNPELKPEPKPEPKPESEPEPEPKPEPTPTTRWALVRRYAFLAIPAIAVLELVAHLVQTHTVVSNEEWLAARDSIRSLAQPEDLVVMAPYWTDAIGRELYKDDILSLAREARPDATRFPRAVEVSIRGQHDGELASWKVESVKKVGPITLTVRDNPSYAPVKDDLTDHVAPGKMSVSVLGAGAGTECAFARGRIETGPLGFGPAIPSERFTCPGGVVGATVMMPGDYRPHRCLLTPALGPGKTLRVRFEGVTFGQLLHGHAGIDWDSTAHDEPPVTLVWKLGERTLGRIVAGNADGWKSFELNTRDMDGQTGELVAEVTSPASRNRIYCFEADTR
jgi:hypothetical protein